MQNQANCFLALALHLTHESAFSDKKKISIFSKISNYFFNFNSVMGRYKTKIVKDNGWCFYLSQKHVGSKKTYLDRLHY